MKIFRSTFHWSVLFGALLLLSLADSTAQTPTLKAQEAVGVKQDVAPMPESYPPDLVQKGKALFRQDCSFCHGRDATGGESGPDLTRSKLVTADVDGNNIGPVVRNGRPDKG